MTDQEKLLDKLQKIKAHADSAAKIGNEAEAQAFAEMLQRLLLKHELDMTDLEFERASAEEPVSQHWVNLKANGVAEKSSRSAWQERLASVVARFNFCRILVCPGSNRFSLVGKKAHAAVAEYLIVTLIRSADRMSDLATGAYNREQHRVQPCTRCGKLGTGHGSKAEVGHAHHTTAYHGFREAWLAGFVTRILERLQATRTDAASSSTAIVRVNQHDAAVEAYMADLAKNKLTRRSNALARPNKLHSDGFSAGRRAADAVNLSGRAVGGASATTKQINGGK